MKNKGLTTLPWGMPSVWSFVSGRNSLTLTWKDLGYGKFCMQVNILPIILSSFRSIRMPRLYVKVCSIAAIFSNVNSNSCEECRISAWNVCELCSKVPPSVSVCMRGYARVNCILYNEVLNLFVSADAALRWGACAAPHTLCVSTGQSNWMLTASPNLFFNM